MTLRTSPRHPQPKCLGKMRSLRTLSSSPALWSAKDHIGRNPGSAELRGSVLQHGSRLCALRGPWVLDLGPRIEPREAQAHGWSILSSNWLVAPPFITGKEGRPGTRGGRELFHCSFPGVEGPAARQGSVPWGMGNVCSC